MTGQPTCARCVFACATSCLVSAAADESFCKTRGPREGPPEDDRVRDDRPARRRDRREDRRDVLRRDSGDRKSTRLNSSHGYISYAVFCLKKKKNKQKCHYASPTRP